MQLHSERVSTPGVALPLSTTKYIYSGGFEKPVAVCGGNYIHEKHKHNVKWYKFLKR